MKNYKKPFTHVVEIECVDFIATSPVSSTLKYSTEKADNTIEALSKKHNNSWGDVWGK